jgi:hypothetical protein
MLFALNNSRFSGGFLNIPLKTIQDRQVDFRLRKKNLFEKIIPSQRIAFP